MLQPVSTEVMKMLSLASSLALVRVIMLSAALAMLVWGCLPVLNVALI